MSLAIRLLFTLVFFAMFLCSVTVHAQDITFSYDSSTEGFAPDQFQADLFDTESGRNFRLSEREIIFDDGSSMVSGMDQIAISPNRGYVAALFTHGGQASVEVYRSDGSLVHRLSSLAEIDPDDPSVKLFMLNNGSFVYRDNIAGFSYFDERGEQVFRASNSSGSLDGETISGFTTPASANVSFLINPEIYDGERVSSRIQKVTFQGETTPVAHFDRMSIQTVDVHPNGRILLVHGIDESNGNHTGKVLSFRGDRLAEFDYEDNDVEKLILSRDGRYVTAHTSGRAMVHRVATGERLGSASFSERVLVASYMPDGILAVLTGTRSGDELGNLRAHIIDIEQRRVVRETTGLTTHGTSYFPLSLHYDAPGRYTLTGATRKIEIRHSLTR